MREHPDRPRKPPRAIPLTGDDPGPWQRWRDQCKACRFAVGKADCMRDGEVVYRGGRSATLAKQAPGGCTAWRPKEATRG